MPHKNKEDKYAYQRRRWKNLKLLAIERLGGRCLDCKKAFHPDVMQFHHEDPETKEMDWSKMRLASQIKRDAELDKCVLLCANCHILRHVG